MFTRQALTEQGLTHVEEVGRIRLALRRRTMSEQLRLLFSKPPAFFNS